MSSARPIVGHPGWRVTNEDGYLVAIAGADEVWVVDDVPGTIAAELSACWTDRPPTADVLSPQALLAVEQLRAVGAFDTASIRTRPRLAVRWAGEPIALLGTALDEVADSCGWPVPGDDEPDVTLVVRTTATLAETAESAAPLLRADRLHLLADLASARTVALGPLVVPGHSACVGCLAGRIANRWGDPAPPPQPAAAGPAGAATAAALLAHQVTLATRGRFPLLDATVSIDLDSLEARRSPCLRTAVCRWCADHTTDGRVSLPWAP